MASPPLPENPPEHRLSRRVFVGAVAALGVTAMSGTALAAPAAVDRAAGVARLGRTVHVLGRTREGWVHIAADGATRPARGLGGAEVNAVAAHRGALVAVGADGVRPAVWQSRDGVSWRRVARFDDVDGHLTAVGAHGGTALAVGARLTLERAPHQRIVMRDSGSGWVTVPARGLEHTDELTATAVGGDATGWTLSTVDANGSLLARSADGVGWTPADRLTDAAVKSFEGTDWVGNAMGGTTGVVRTRRAVPQGQAVGLLDGRSYWLVSGHIVTATA
jgi:hypothetical protein